MQQGQQQVRTKSNAYKVNRPWFKPANHHGQTIPSSHPTLVPCQGAMVGNVLVVGVGAV
jgi:hypothetical protein